MVKHVLLVVALLTLFSCTARPPFSDSSDTKDAANDAAAVSFPAPPKVPALQ
ncbi:hypothetical protein HYZ98_05195 [Candidatus Peregrinibacteria bacterium]|nr:hypothetical protein [Candidatus Peregrinibacteria bacterium]